VGVRPEADVVVPLHLLAALRPFEIQLGVMELHVGADQVGDDVREDRLQAVIPETRVLLHGVRNAAQPRRVRAMLGLQVENRVRLRHLAAALDQLLGGGAQPRDPFVADRALHVKIALAEILLALGLCQHLRWNRKNLLGSHIRVPLPTLDYPQSGHASGTPSPSRLAWKRSSSAGRSRTAAGVTCWSRAKAASAPAASPTFHSTGCNR